MLKKIKLRLFALVVLCVVFQMTLLPHISSQNARPDICCALFIVLLVQFPAVHAISIAFFIGLIKSVFSSNLFGLDIIAYVVPALFFPALIRKADMSHVIIYYSVVFLWSFVYFLVYGVVYMITVHAFEICGRLLIHCFWASLYTTLIAIVVKYAVKKFIPRKTDQYELFT